MSQSLQRFVDKVQSAEARGKQDLVIGIGEARDMHADLTRLLLELDTLKKIQVAPSKDRIVEVQVTGGTF